MAKVVVVIIVVPFALFGIETLLGGGGVQYVAEVNGQGISAVELQQQINQQKRRLLMSIGDDVDPAMLDDQLLAGPALEFVVQKTLLMQAAKEYGLAVSDARLGQFIADMQVFQVEGRFDADLYRRIVSDQGYSSKGFQDTLREELIVDQLQAGLASSDFATGAEVEQLAKIEGERRDVRYMLLPLESFRDEMALDDEEVVAWYEENRDRYITAESVDIEYIELTLEDFRQPVEESRLRELYELEKDGFEVPEQRRVSHILFEQGAGESDAALNERIEAAVARLDEGEDFAAVARELSDDVGSADLGGDLGFTAGDTFPPEMEAAVARMALDELSPALKTDAGRHLVKVTDIRAGETRDFESVRPELELRLQEEQASLALVKAVEDLRDLVFNADDLAGPAAELEMQVSRADAVERDTGEGLFANPRLNAAAFSDEVLDDRYNSEVIELDPEHFVVLRAIDHRLPETRPLAEVRSRVERAMADEIAGRNIRREADRLLRRLHAGDSIEKLAREGDYEWQVELAATRDNRSLPESLLGRLFRMPAPESPGGSFEYVQNPEGDIELFELVRVTETDPSRLTDAQRRRLQGRIGAEMGRRIDAYYRRFLRDGAEVIRGS